MNKKFNKSFDRERAPRTDFKVEKRNIDQIDASVKGESFALTGVIEQIVQTGGPTIFYISDGTGLLALKAFEGAGVRAYPELVLGDVIEATVVIQEFNDELEGEVKYLKQASTQEKIDFTKKVLEIQKERAKVKDIPFLIKDQILDKLKDRFITAAEAVRLAILQNRPIIVRHHNDSDGYSSGYSLERAILPLIVKQHNSVKAAWEFYTRSPCNAPMYEIEDSIRDTAHSLSNSAKFSNKMPLVLIVDTGSNENDLLGIKQGKVHGIDFIVVDHHRFEKDLVSSEVIVNINPFLVGEDGARFSAGMLCTEFARLINSDPTLNITQIPAMAGLADRINNPEAMSQYLELASKKGYTKEMLYDISMVLDFVSSKLRFMEAREYIEVLFGEPMAKQKALIDLLAPHLKNLRAKGLEIALSVVKSEKLGKTNVLTIEIESSFPRGFYPKTGKIVEGLHDYYQEKGETNLLTLGILTDAITIRATDGANFSVPDMIQYMHKNLPSAFVEGGGHKNAGSIRFIPGKRPEVLENLKKYLKG